MQYDFSGYASKNDIECDDGRIIRANAFAEDDGEVVSLVYGHDHKNMPNIVGHAMLENRPDGLYCYGTLNRETEGGKLALSLIKNGDIRSLSVFANKLLQKGKDVIRGKVREVSLVISGANRGAKIDTVLAHSFDGGEGGPCVEIFAGDENPIIHSDAEAEYEEYLAHAGDGGDKQSDAVNYDGDWLEHTVKTMNEDQKIALKIMMGLVADEAEKASQKVSSNDEEKKEIKHSSIFSIFGNESLSHQAEEKSEDDEDITSYENDGEDPDMYESSEENQNGNDEKDAGSEPNTEIKHTFKEGENKMKRNLWESQNGEVVIDQAKLCHEIMQDAVKFGTVKDAFMAHMAQLSEEMALAHDGMDGESQDYGIIDIDMLFPNAKNYTSQPEFIKRRTEWVNAVITGVRVSPFSRIKTTFADITEDDARARGYIKGDRKINEVFSLLKRETNPTTVYKIQTIDRDDIIDIVDFSILQFIKEEMRIMYDEEVARAILVGDGRDPMNRLKIKEECIRPIWTDDPLFTIKKSIAVAADMTNEARAEALIDSIIRAHKQYRGSGKPTLFISPDLLADMLLIKDGIKRPMYTSIDQLKNVIRCSDIVEVPIFENLSRLDGNDTKYLAAIMVNLTDYATGRDKGGQLSFFDDFNINFNQNEYLMESRFSGALVKPFSAVAFEFVYGLAVEVTPEDPTVSCYGKLASELQSNVFVNDASIQGTLNYVTGYTQWSGIPAEQEGNYLALHFSFSEGATVKIKTIGGYHDEREPEITTADPQLVLRVKNNREKLQVTITKDGTTLVKTYSLSMLKLLAKQ